VPAYFTHSQSGYIDSDLGDQSAIMSIISLCVAIAT
jgi:preprotein translocase subunit SecD